MLGHTAAMCCTAMRLTDGKPVRVPIAPAEPGILSADTGYVVPAAVNAAVQFLSADGNTVQAKL